MKCRKEEVYITKEESDYAEKLQYLYTVNNNIVVYILNNIDNKTYADTYYKRVEDIRLEYEFLKKELLAKYFKNISADKIQNIFIDTDNNKMECCIKDA